MWVSDKVNCSRKYTKYLTVSIKCRLCKMSDNFICSWKYTEFLTISVNIVYVGVGQV